MTQEELKSKIKEINKNMQAIKKVACQNSLSNLLRGLSLRKQPLTTSEHKNAPNL